MRVIETKVIAAAAGSGAGAAVGSFLLWLLGVVVWHMPDTAAHATDAVAAVPGPVSAVVLAGLAIAGSAVGGYAAPHTSRPDLTDATESDAADAPVPEPAPAAEPAPVAAP